ncbi:LpqB family beta-propeller domain-containing protein [Streptomyces sp. NPDC051561]|uniref:LpqB family beta-propeller domain-containing protein n=1 Tax=Streptomyces sp. NPDC051561 TaxID=3365658 RepID=UPI0037B64B2F
MPDHGDVKEVKSSQRVDSQVRVYSVPPRSGARPEEIVDGFLEAMTSDDPGFDTARKYLTKGASKRWNPGSVTTVLAVAPARVETSRHNGTVPGYSLSGQQIAYLNEQNAFQAEAKPYDQSLRLIREKNPDGKGGKDGKDEAGEWRIDTPPPGLLLGESDFQRIFRPVNKYYFAPSSATDDSGQRWLVADPVYVRKRTDPQTRLDPVAQAVKALLDGPSNWLKPVVNSSFPTRASLKEGVKSLTFGDHNSLKVPLSAKGANVSQKICRDMAAQLLFTLRDLTATSRIDQVEIQNEDLSSLCVLSGDAAGGYAPDSALRTPSYQYFLDGKQRLVQMRSNAERDEAVPVPGALGDSLHLRSAAVSRDERNVAGVAVDGYHLYVAPIAADSRHSTPYTSAFKDRSALSAPSWDGRGDLWVADRDPRNRRVLRMVEGVGEPQKVKIDELGDGYVESLRVSADGVRAALLVVDGKGKDARTTLKVGRVERGGTQERPEVRIAGLRSAAPQMEQVTAMSWAGPSRMVVVGREAGGVQQMRYVQTDGSTSAAGLLPGANQVTAVASSDTEQLPLLAQSQEDGIVRLPLGANWKTVVSEGKGSLPFYPG